MLVAICLLVMTGNSFALEEKTVNGTITRQAADDGT